VHRTVLGEAVTRAQHLAGLAPPGHVLLTESVKMAVSDAFDCAELGRATLPGETETVALVAVQAMEESSILTVPLDESIGASLQFGDLEIVRFG